MGEDALKQIIELLSRRGFSFKHLHHDTIPTDSASAATVRDTRVEDGAKALILETSSKRIVQAVIPANHRLDMKSLKRVLDESNVRLVSPDRAFELTGCVVGSIPPFAALWRISVIVSDALSDKDVVVCSAGTREDSLKLSPSAIIAVNDAMVASISESS